jgi:hypothetical protein
MDEAIWDGYYNDDEMTEEEWDDYSADFERRYNEHARSIKSSGSRRVSTSGRRYYDEDDGLSNLLPTEEEINHYRRALGCDDEYNVERLFRATVDKMIRDDDTMASFFAYSQM